MDKKETFDDVFKKNTSFICKYLFTNFYKELFIKIEIVHPEFDLYDYFEEGIDYINKIKNELNKEYKKNKKYFSVLSKALIGANELSFIRLIFDSKKYEKIEHSILFPLTCISLFSELEDQYESKNSNFYLDDFFDSISRNTIQLVCDFVSNECIKKKIHELKTIINSLANLTYEKKRNNGVIYLLNTKEVSSIEMQFKFISPKEFSEDNIKYIRKLLELTDSNDKVGLITDCNNVYGIGKLNEEVDYYSLTFKNGGEWFLMHKNKELLNVRNNRLIFPIQRFSKAQFKEKYKLVFPNALNNDKIDTFINAIEILIKENKGTVIVITEKAKNLVEEFSDLTTIIQPVPLNKTNIKKLSSIDGAIIVDSDFVCYGFGLILDGFDTTKGNPARGSRYNSSERFYSYRTNEMDEKMIVFILSDDGNFDIFPDKVSYHDAIINYLEKNPDSLKADLLDFINPDNPFIFSFILRNMIRKGIIKSELYENYEFLSINNQHGE